MRNFSFTLSFYLLGLQHHPCVPLSPSWALSRLYFRHQTQGLPSVYSWPLLGGSKYGMWSDLKTYVKLIRLPLCLLQKHHKCQFFTLHLQALLFYVSIILPHPLHLCWCEWWPWSWWRRWSWSGDHKLYWGFSWARHCARYFPHAISVKSWQQPTNLGGITIPIL